MRTSGISEGGQKKAKRPYVNGRFAFISLNYKFLRAIQNDKTGGQNLIQAVHLLLSDYDNAKLSIQKPRKLKQIFIKLLDLANYFFVRGRGYLIFIQSDQNTVFFSSNRLDCT